MQQGEVMHSLAYIAPWVLASVGVGIAVGFYISRSRGKGHEHELAERERQATLRVLVELLSSVEQISGDVECHNSEIRQRATDVGNLKVAGEMESVKQALLGHMITLLSSNKRMQSDLLCARYRMEEQAQEIDHVRREARTDPLTTVANRKAFDEKLHLLISAWERHRHSFVLMMVDLDHLKRINDAHGHQAGDLALSKLGTSLRQWLREGDFVARYGGDEFSVLMPKTDLETGVQTAEMIRARAATQASGVTYRGEQVALSMSIGLTVAAEGDTTERIIQRADEALYRAKRQGRNQVQFEEPPPPDVLAPLTFGDSMPLPTPTLPAGTFS